MKRGKNRRRKRTPRQKQEHLRKSMKKGLIFLGAVFVILAGFRILKPEWFRGKYREFNSAEIDASQPEIDVQLLTVNPNSRPGTKTDRITGIVVHYTANPGSTAMDNRNYFESLKDSGETQVSSNFVVGLEGEIVQCVPTWEVAYASNSRNQDTVSIECCHPDETGVFREETYRSMVQLCAWLCMKFDLDEEDVIRHYDVTGKNCPKYFVENEEAWLDFKEDIRTAIANTAG